MQGNQKTGNDPGSWLVSDPLNNLNPRNRQANERTATELISMPSSPAPRATEARTRRTGSVGEQTKPGPDCDVLPGVAQAGSGTAGAGSQNGRSQFAAIHRRVAIDLKLAGHLVQIVDGQLLDLHNPLFAFEGRTDFLELGFG